MNSSKDDTKDSELHDYEANLQNLEKIIRHLEDDNPNLNDLVEQYQKGMGYYRACEKLLKEAELKIEQIRRENRDQDPEELALPEDTE
ncbi:MAG: exodeoxyribonuclease VII small subunit [Opitutales bacterium]|nr:exodeoxyribonuclease VII small subunit [Opitutales bacterium]MCH8541884.1 exodeoxyribonuclease VII small subunit [Opitutales bacterium]